MTVFRPTALQDAFTLSGHYYTAPEIFEQEIQRIFSNHWICVGRSEQIAEAGDYFLTQIGEENLIVLRDAQGNARAFFNVCRHRGTRLYQQAQGHLGETIRCSHGWRYSLDGQLRSNRYDSAAEENALFGCALFECEGFLWVNLAPNPVPFVQTFSPLLRQFAPWRLTRLRIAEQMIDEVQANWKLIFQAYCDRYYNRSSWRSPDLSEGAFLGASRPIDCNSPRLERCGTSDRAEYYSLFPTMLLSLFPGYALALRLEAQAADRTRIVCEWLFDFQSGDRPNCATIETWKLNHRQAWFRCEQTQRSMHRLHFADSNRRTAFDREYLRVLGASALR